MTLEASRARTIVLVALIVRLLTVLPALGRVPFSDGLEYHGYATRLAEGRGFCKETGQPTAYRPPLWPAVISVLYRAVGPRSGAARVLQACLGTLLVAAILLLANVAVPGDARVRAIAGWWAALSPTLLYYSHSLFSESLFGLLLALSLAGLLTVWRQPSGRLAAATGLGLGLTCLCRGSTLLLLPPLLAWLGLRHWRQAVVIGACAALTIAPWSLRNACLVGWPAPIDTNGALNFYWGNHPTTSLLKPWTVVNSEAKPFPAVHGEIAQQQAATREALGFIRAQPGRFVFGLAWKAGNLWGLERGLPSGLQAGLYGPDAQRKLIALPLSLLALVEGFALLTLAALGFGLCARREVVVVQAIVMLTLTAVHAVSYGHSRYRFGAVPLLLVLAAVALSHRDWRSSLAAVPVRQRNLAVLLAWLMAINQVVQLGLAR